MESRAKESAEYPFVAVYVHPVSKCPNSAEAMEKIIPANTVQNAKTLALDEQPICHCGKTYELIEVT